MIFFRVLPCSSAEDRLTRSHQTKRSETLTQSLALMSNAAETARGPGSVDPDGDPAKDLAAPRGPVVVFESQGNHAC